MHKPYLSSVKTLLHFNLCVWTLILQTFLATSVKSNDVTGDFSNNYQDSNVDSNNNSTSETNNYNATGAGEKAPVMSSIAPTIMGGGGNDSCLMPTTMGFQVSLFGLSQGTMVQDAYCNRRKNARLLGTPQQIGGLGLQVSGISTICGDPDVFKAMILASTPCPIMDVLTGKLLMGKDAVDKYRENPKAFIVGYEEDKEFWDSLLRIGEDLTNEINEAEIANNSRDIRSISERFRSTRRVTSTTRLQPDGGSEDTVTD